MTTKGVFIWIKPHSSPRCGSAHLWGTASLWPILMALLKVCFCAASDAWIVPGRKAFSDAYKRAFT